MSDIRYIHLSRKHLLPNKQPGMPSRAMGALLVMLMAIYSAMAKANIDHESAEIHPSCLDIDPRTSLRNDFLLEPLDLNCPQTGSSSDVFDYFGYTTYERPRDPAGERLGSLGYQRFAADDGAALYLLRIESGGNAVSTEIMTGKEVKKSNQRLLEQGQLHSAGEDCQGVSDIWIEPDVAIHLVVELSAYEALQALLLPTSGPPSASRKTQLLNALLKQQQQDDYQDFRRACAVTAEYRLDSASMQLQLTMLRFDIDDERSKDAFNWFQSLLPASENLDVAMILEDDLPNIRDKLMAPFKDQYQFAVPQQPDETFSIFFQQLKSAVERRDIVALLEMTTKDVMLGFGGSGGHQDLQSWLTHDNADDDWQSLSEMLAIPGIQLSPEVFCVPYPGCVGSESAYFSFDTYITIQPNTPMYALPMDNAQVLRKLNFERVDWQYPYDDKARFRLVQTFAGERGYIDKALLRSPFDMRMEIVSTPQGWLIQSILSGD
ncbi:hypothetical protein [Methylophaga muralis]|uniref:SH3 domain-containing protein n=1 Tax=Methylophaga muralis TaxID=291169 RepID=A0A1E3GQP7_9GAMM|nr:hypothetical protein [Methylophaga muralis]ODN66344.1 hypothetical protein A9E74_01910 [Methylophaga muralis]